VTEQSGMTTSLLTDLSSALQLAYSASVQVVSAHELTRGASGAEVRRLTFTDGAGPGGTVIVKTSAPGSGGLRLDASGDVEREARVYGLSLATTAGRVLSRPDLVAHGPSRETAWMILEDVAASLEVGWDLDAALNGVARIAQLKLRDTTMGDKVPDWLVSHEHRAFEHHCDEAASNLARLSAGESAGDLAAPLDLGVIGACLASSSDIAAELDRAPRAFQHGDFKNSNAGFHSDGTLVLIDWAQAGLAPVGSDLAVILSGFTGFGGNRGPLGQEAFDEAVIEKFCRAFQGGDQTSEVRRVLDLWWTSWAVQVRLGPGLRAAWGIEAGSPTRAAIIDDIREGLVRAERAAKRLGV